MIWLTWRQFRTQAVVTGVLVAAFAVALAITGPALFDLYRSTGLAGCASACDSFADNFRTQALNADPVFSTLYTAGLGALVLLPPLIGVFWGAPLVSRELEAGTHRLVWSQTISRGRWLAVKLIGVGLAAVLAAGLISVAVSWWSGPLDEVNGGRVQPLVFAARGIVPLGYAAFAFVLGVTVGVLTRRLLVAMAITLLLVAVVQIVTPFFVREHLTTPVSLSIPFSADRIDGIGFSPQDGKLRVEQQSPLPDAWVLTNQTVQADGTLFTGPVGACGPDGGMKGCKDYLTTLGLQQKISYLPGAKFWTMQWRELGLFVGLSALLSLFAVWWVRRRVV